MEVENTCKPVDKTRRSWKPNVQEKRLFSYILDRHIRVKVTTHALRCIDKAGGIDEYLLKTPYNKMDTEMGLLWKAKIEKMYEELGKMEVCFFSPEQEAKIESGFKEYKTAKTEAKRSARRNFSQSMMGLKLLGNENQLADKASSQDQTEEKINDTLELAKGGSTMRKQRIRGTWEVNLKENHLMPKLEIVDEKQQGRGGGDSRSLSTG
ncbi:hypothetical protein Taro_007897 [Colocasia esculenta]|uniref:Large ribosomal subunit protein bL28m n=1 Tax=Colocasia esculenta TaxID=4460 RepID=A0A843TSI6_COLES|nr:hypothetical protein [Colocasia esculenta]